MTRMQRTFMLMVLSALGGAVLAGGAIKYDLPRFIDNPPATIPVKPITEEQIKEGVRIEQRQKRYKQAARQAERVYLRNGCGRTLADVTGQVAVDTGVSPRLLAALVFVESSCRPRAVSGRDSVGLMQVNPRVWHYSRKALMDPETNLRIGAGILATYIHRYGLVEGLHHYNGLGNPTNEYAEKVLTKAGIVV